MVFINIFTLQAVLLSTAFIQTLFENRLPVHGMYTNIFGPGKIFQNFDMQKIWVYTHSEKETTPLFIYIVYSSQREFRFTLPCSAPEQHLKYMSMCSAQFTAEEDSQHSLEFLAFEVQIICFV